MDTLKAITTRRSVRNYTDEKFDSKLLIEIISYGFYAPSAHNQQAWKYYIISKQEDHNFL
ncbi:nitroreductase family protein [bacterium]|jgi:nitroreductase|nr:nitroreductase family protein [bacterium]